MAIKMLQHKWNKSKKLSVTFKVRQAISHVYHNNPPKAWIDKVFINNILKESIPHFLVFIKDLLIKFTIIYHINNSK